ncbi:MAG: patatin-like phospholipase family protein [Corticimicrobacter sp.]|uniref:patatin-like phospholipase family protein n=1 Tax=Corticimicrobacter sp. TaxID=2678536 RepID=UPI0032DBAF26
MAAATGLVLAGGGARAAYQVGALCAIADILDPNGRADFPLPFGILCGTSAGAINAAALACGASHPRLALRRLRHLWGTLDTSLVYRTDAWGLSRGGGRWLSMLMLGWLWSAIRQPQPRSLLDNAPLEQLLEATLDFGRLPGHFESGALSALAITASGYDSGEHLTFYQARYAIKPWRRTLRRAVSTRIGVSHLMASSAIPFVFPARPLETGQGREWCGDGSMRQLAPISPAIHLGAQRVLVIGTAFSGGDTHPEQRGQETGHPSLAQIGGQAMATVFLDSIPMDVERLERLNAMLALSPEAGRALDLRPVRVLALAPSRRLDDLALMHLDSMPPMMRMFLRALGVSTERNRLSGGTLVSYLLFEAAYTNQLIELGYTDTMQRIAEVEDFFQESSI